jgi:hypothetical protein
MQQSQVVQRALSSQQALANSVVQQNIMAMRLEAQQTSLMRPDVAKRLNEQTYVWPTNKPTVETNREDDVRVKADKVTGATPSTSTPSTGEVETTSAKETVSETEVVVVVPEQQEATQQPQVKKGKVSGALLKAFEQLSPPQKTGGEPDPVFVAPSREATNVEKRLEQFFSAKVHIYD